MFPLPFVAPEYGNVILEQQLSSKLLAFSHLPTIIISLVFAIFLYRQTKKLSSLYLLLLVVTFSVWSYLDLVAWTGTARAIMFTWSVLDIYNMLFVILTYWFLYAFVKGTDVPLWQKLVSCVFLIPSVVYTVLSTNLNTFYNPTMYAYENDYVALYASSVGILFFFVIAVFTLVEYRKASAPTEKQKILLGGLGTGIFLSIFALSFLVTNLMLYLDIGTVEEAYNITVYALFGMPIFVGLLSYLIAKYQAFDLKVIKSIQYIFILVVLLFVTVFI